MLLVDCLHVPFWSAFGRIGDPDLSPAQRGYAAHFIFAQREIENVQVFRDMRFFERARYGSNIGLLY